MVLAVFRFRFFYFVESVTCTAVRFFLVCTKISRVSVFSCCSFLCGDHSVNQDESESNVLPHGMEALWGGCAVGRC